MVGTNRQAYQLLMEQADLLRKRPKTAQIVPEEWFALFRELIDCPDELPQVLQERLIEQERLLLERYPKRNLLGRFILV